MTHRMLSVALVLSLFACGGSGSDGGAVQLDSQGAYQEFFGSYCLPLAEVMTGLANQASMSPAVGDPIECPGGGNATYDDASGMISLNDCQGAGVTVNGTIGVSLLEPKQAQIVGGNLTAEGAFAGMATINAGTMSWELPVADATAYWELHLVLDGAEVCIWSGAETGPCPSS